MTVVEAENNDKYKFYFFFFHPLWAEMSFWWLFRFKHNQVEHRHYISLSIHTYLILNSEGLMTVPVFMSELAIHLKLLSFAMHHFKWLIMYDKRQDLSACYYVRDFAVRGSVEDFLCLHQIWLWRSASPVFWLGVKVCLLFIGLFIQYDDVMNAHRSSEVFNKIHFLFLG